MLIGGIYNITGGVYVHQTETQSHNTNALQVQNTRHMKERAGRGQGG